MIDFTKNIILYAGNRVGSHRFADLVLQNYDNYSVEHPDQPEITIFESRTVRGWFLNPGKQVEDLQKINSNGKKWLCKFGPGAWHSIFWKKNFLDDLSEVILVRESVVDTIYSVLLARALGPFVTASPHHITSDQELEHIKTQEQALIDNWRDPHIKSHLLEYSMVSVCSSVYASLSLLHFRDIPIITYDYLTSEKQSLFPKTENTTVLDADQIVDGKTRFKTPVLEEFRSLVQQDLEHIMKDHLEPLNRLKGKADLEFRL